MRRPWGALLIAAGVVSLLAAASAHGQGTRGGSARTVTPAELAQMLKSKDFFLVNVLPAYEGEIPQTDAFISYLDTAARLDLYPTVKSSAIVLYCRTGRSAALAQRDLLDAGYTDVRVLAGGLQAWEQEARPVLRRSSPPALPYPAASGDRAGPVPEGCPCGLPSTEP